MNIAFYGLLHLCEGESSAVNLPVKDFPFIRRLDFDPLRGCLLNVNGRIAGDISSGQRLINFMDYLKG